ncbi:MAG TPA: metalloregulator ArsR/SmtB family transcription factor [Thiomicrospira sp.]|nr:metalloregulator ArsR/SmtB family transcription factor [Thiomicrospira sp.]
MSDIKRQLFQQLATVAHSLGSPQRIEILDYLAQAERSVDELSQLTQLSTANTSRHLQVLKTNGLVKMQKQGKSRLYRLAGQDVVLLVKQLRFVAENHLAEVNRLKQDLSNSEETSPVLTAQETLSQLAENDLLLVDVRPPKEYEQGHIKGAMNIPPENIDSALEALPFDKTIVAYCRGPYCTYSHKLVETLRQKGVNALRLEEGFPEWKAAGLPCITNE